MCQWTFENGTLSHADRAMLQGVGPEVGMEADALGNGVFLTSDTASRSGGDPRTPVWASRIG